MIRFNWRKAVAALLLSVLLLSGATACSKVDTSPYAQTQKESTQRGAKAVAKDAEQGSSFNKFFPSSGQGYTVVFSQEKKGFAEAKLKKDAKDMALLSISDTISLPTAAKKYDSATENLAGYPVLEIGNTQTGILVAGRYQVKALSRDPEFTKENRRAWIQKFDLIGLSKLK
ncbi:MAG: hypothetical protein SNJ57_06655 [Cyanobacteriota bacterium]